MEPRTTRCAVLGAGPIGLEAALYAVTLGMDVTVYEQGEEIAANVRDWGHVTMFSPFGMNCSSLGTGLLAEAGHDLPEDEAYQSGAEYVEAYLRPLAELPLLAGRIQLGARVVSLGKDGLAKGDLIGQEARLERPFRLLVQAPDGTERVSRADVVLDCTGMYDNPNWLGNGGIPALGERELRERISYRLPDVLGSEREAYAGKTTLLAGDGHSAATTLLGLLELARQAPGTRVVWLANHDHDPLLPVVADDPLPRRAALIEQANRIAAEGDANLDRILGGLIEEIGASPGGGFRVRIGTEPPREIEVDQIVANVGFSPDNSLYRELQVHECYASRGPMNLAAALLTAGGGADCLAATPLGPATLQNPEPGFFMLGSKSYGKGFNFLLRTGLEQIRDVFTLITDRMELDLYYAS